MRPDIEAALQDLHEYVGDVCGRLEEELAPLRARLGAFSSKRKDLLTQYVARQITQDEEIRESVAIGRQAREVEGLAEFAERIGRTLDVVDGDFCTQRRIVEKLDLQVMLRVFEGRRDVRVIKLQDLDVFIHVPHVEGNAS